MVTALAARRWRHAEVAKQPRPARTPALRLFLGCPIFACAALGRALTRHEARTIEVMAWDTQAHTYQPCKIR
jgi:hypothetical protein